MCPTHRIFEGIQTFTVLVQLTAPPNAILNVEHHISFAFQYIIERGGKNNNYFLKQISTFRIIISFVLELGNESKERKNL